MVNLGKHTSGYASVFKSTQVESRGRNHSHFCLPVFAGYSRRRSSYSYGRFKKLQTKVHWGFPCSWSWLIWVSTAGDILAQRKSRTFDHAV